MKPRTRTLREMFGDDLDLFLAYCRDGFHIRYGFDTPEGLKYIVLLAPRIRWG